MTVANTGWKKKLGLDFLGEGVSWYGFMVDTALGRKGQMLGLALCM